MVWRSCLIMSNAIAFIKIIYKSSDLDIDKADLINRGLSEIEIKHLGAKSTNSGYILPIKNPLGQILGFQIRLRNADSGRYRWHKPFGISAQQQNGELPLAFYGDVQVDCRRVVLVEGTGVKPYLAAKCVVVWQSELRVVSLSLVKKLYKVTLTRLGLSLS